MVKPLSKHPHRVKFRKGKQKLFLMSVINKLSLNTNAMAKLANVHPRSFRDWKQEKFTISLPALETYCKVSNTPKPKNIKIKDPFWYGNLGGKIGWINVIKKYGEIPKNEQYRKEKWYEWWESIGKYKKHPIIGVYKPIHKPNFSKKLAEFAGVSMGDGGISKWQISVTINSEDDKEYGFFVEKIINDLFKVKVSRYIYKNTKALKLVASGKELVNFCHERIGLPIGNKIKQGIDVPLWIKGKLNFEKACLRGLIDTDGCLFCETHNINGKKYLYRRLNFTNLSRKLINSVYKIIKKLNLDPRIRRNGTCVQIENKENIIKYFNIVGTSNAKHLRKFMLM